MSFNREVRNFSISLKVEYSDGNFIDLFGNWDIEIDWDSSGEGRICGSELKDGKKLKKRKGK